MDADIGSLVVSSDKIPSEFTGNRNVILSQLPFKGGFQEVVRLKIDQYPEGYEPQIIDDCPNSYVTNYLGLIFLNINPRFQSLLERFAWDNSQLTQPIFRTNNDLYNGIKKYILKV
jgi:hypothetical protein